MEKADLDELSCEELELEEIEETKSPEIEKPKLKSSLTGGFMDTSLETGKESYQH